MHEQGELFNFTDQFEKNESELQDIQIVTTTLHYSQKELKYFKKMSKLLIKKYWGEDYKNGNINDLILKIFENEYKTIEKG
tara:strand:+ start:202 stop:444 length:243 start_codon:yes stop_codon:yes gene_type:complete